MIKTKDFIVWGYYALQHKNWNFKTRDITDFLTLFEVIFF